MYFTKEEFQAKYLNYSIPQDYEIEAVCTMIYSQIGLAMRNDWDVNTVPEAIKKASMEQMRFMYEHDIPFIDSANVKAGSMSADLNSDYSTLALRYLANGGYLYRGTPFMNNMSLDIPFGE